MTTFIQLHSLTPYPPANLNRDDLGRPKTARMGGVDRLRVSSQSLKRTWRTSDLFQAAMGSHLGTRTRRLGCEAEQALLDAGVKEKDALSWASEVAAVFGKPQKGSSELEQLVHVSPTEKAAVESLVSTLCAEKRGATKDELDLLRSDANAVDMSLFGRMLASTPKFNVEAACQVAHALSVHAVTIEDDYFTAVDDLNSGDEDRGSAHIGEAGFASALFYSYICIDRDLLVTNLGGDEALADKAIQALIEAALTVSPKGKQNSFASRARATFAMVEKGTQQPRSLSVAFLKAVGGHDYEDLAIASLRKQRDNFDQVYGACADSSYEFCVPEGQGTMNDLLAFVAGK